MLSDPLQSLYDEISKHGQYQALPSFMRNDAEIQNERYKHFKLCDQRLNFLLKSDILESVNSLVEVGANIGFFALSLAKKYPHLAIKTIEANKTFCAISRKIADAYHLTNIEVEAGFYPFRDHKSQPKADLGIIFNVMHHGGAEYDQEYCTTRNDWYAYSEKVMAALACSYDKMILQIGYNWGGDIKEPLHAVTDPVGFSVKLAQMFAAAGWTITAVGVPLQVGDSYEYSYMDTSGQGLEDVCTRLRQSKQLDKCKDYTLSEFFRRPIFILSKAAA